MRMLRAAGADYLRGYSLRNELLFEGEQCLQSASLTRVLGETHLLEAQTVKLLLQIPVLGTHMTEIDVVVPDAADAIADGIECLLSWNKYLHNPQANERHRFSRCRYRTPHLRGEHDDLRHQQPEQHGDVPVSCEEIFHYFLVNHGATEPRRKANRVIGCRAPKGSRSSESPDCLIT